MSPKVRVDLTKIPPWRVPSQRLERPIRAYRCWKLTLYPEPLLTSVAWDDHWEQPTFRAHKKPVDLELWDKQKDYEVWKSGIYALKSPWLARRYVARVYMASVWGALDIWGRVIEHEKGYRAECCMIKKLYLLSRGLGGRRDMRGGIILSEETAREIADKLSTRYECDVKISNRGFRPKFRHNV